VIVQPRAYDFRLNGIEGIAWLSDVVTERHFIFRL
jgi:hypothetical protein